MSFRAKMLSGKLLAGTFVKTPDHTMIEILHMSGLDFVCLDAEHSPFDRGQMDACLAVARAKGLPTLVRVPAGRPEIILGVLDSGADGIVVPHVDSAEKAREVAKAARFGLGGRGYAGSTRWAGFAGGSMAALIEKSRNETIVLVQIEEPAGVEAAAEIAAVDGVDGLFIGPSDLSVSYGKTSVDSDELYAAFQTVGAACKANGKAFVSWAADVEKAREWRPYGVSMFFIASELSWILAGAKKVAADIAAFDK